MLELEIIKPKMLEMELLGQAPSNSIIQTQEKEVTPTTNVQEITPDKDYDALSKVTVKAVTNEIDENISSENILQGVSILGVEGILKPEKEEEVKTIEIKTNRLTSIKPTEGKTMGEVLVTTAVTPTKGDIDITENGNYDVSDYVGANVNVEPDLQNKEVNITENGTTTVEVDENYDGMGSVTINTNIEIPHPILQDKSITITENGTTNIVADSGYDGLNNVEVVTNVASSGADFKITNGKNFFQYDYRIENLNDLLPLFDLVYCDYMFNGSKQTSLDLRKLNTSNAISMEYMLNNCMNLKTMDVSGWNTSKVTKMKYLFQGNTQMETLNISGWNTSKVTDMSYMFRGCAKLTTLDLSNWNTSNVTNMTYMFYDCVKLTKLDIRNFDFSKVTKYSAFFNNSFDANCEIIVKDETAKNWILARRSDLTNIKTVAEL